MNILEKAAQAIARRGYRHPSHDLDVEILRSHTDPAALGVCHSCGESYPCPTLESVL